MTAFSLECHAERERELQRMLCWVVSHLPSNLL